MSLAVGEPDAIDAQWPLLGLYLIVYNGRLEYFYYKLGTYTSVRSTTWNTCEELERTLCKLIQ